MDKQLEKKLGKLDKKLVLLFKDLKHYSDATLNKPPAQNAWSVLEVMQHLYLTEQTSLTSIKNEIEKNTPFADSGAGDKIRSFVLGTFLASPVKFKAPYFINRDAFVKNPTFWEIAKDWNKERLRLKKFCKEIPPQLADKSLYKHPRGGFLNLDGLLSFYNFHFDRHHKQIKRTIRQIDAVKQI